MARKAKTGIVYYSHDCDMSKDRKIKLLLSRCGLDGYAVYNLLLEELYRNEGYYLLVDDDFISLFIYDYRIKEAEFKKILKECLSSCLFDLDMYNSYKILTSKRIQKNYCSGTDRRTYIEFIEQYLLIESINLEFTRVDRDGNKKTEVNIKQLDVNINLHDDDIMLHDDNNGTQITIHNITKQYNTIHSPKDSDGIPYEEIINYLNEKLNTKYSAKTKSTMKAIKARINEDNACLEDFKKVIDIKAKEWVGTDQAKYLRPETLFSNKFEGYLNQLEGDKQSTNSYNKYNNEPSRGSNDFLGKSDYAKQKGEAYRLQKVAEWEAEEEAKKCQ